MNKINKLFLKKKNAILSIYFTAGFPKLNDTETIIYELQSAGADLIEIGIPFSDPLADGPTIQHSSEVALNNGMSMKVLFNQLRQYHSKNAETSPPLILMGYLNPVLKFGVDNFCRSAQEVGISGVILPDLPLEEYNSEYKNLFTKYGLINIFLITPQTSEDRIRLIDKHSNGFIYMVSSSSVTGATKGVNMEMNKYFSRIKKMKLKNPLLVGFGIHDKKSFAQVCEYASGAIIGSAFIKHLERGGLVTEFVKGFYK